MSRRKKTEQEAAEPAAAETSVPAETPTAKRGRGRPKKEATQASEAAPAKRGPGRPKKTETAGTEAAPRKPGRRGRPRKSSTVSLGRRIDALIRELTQIRDQVDKIEASAGTLDRVISALKS